MLAMLALNRGSAVKPASAFTAFKSAARAVPWVSQACIRTLEAENSLWSEGNLESSSSNLESNLKSIILFQRASILSEMFYTQIRIIV